MNDLKIKLTFEVVKLCQRALMRVHCLTIAKRLEKNPNTKLTGSTDFKELHDKLCILTMEFSWAQALILGSAVRSYMEKEVRETSYDYKLGQDLLGALSDYCDTHMAASLETEKKPAKKRGYSQEEKDEMSRFMQDALWIQKRDDIFRAMVENVNVWGNVVTDTYLDPVVRPNPGSFVPRKFPESWSHTTKKFPKPIADAEVDQDLTNGEPLAFNERMKKEGAKQSRSDAMVENFKNLYGGDPRPANTVDDARKKGYIA